MTSTFDIICAISERGLWHVLANIFDRVDPEDIRAATEVSVAWREAIEKNVMPAWSAGRKADWTWLYGPTEVREINYLEHLDEAERSWAMLKPPETVSKFYRSYWEEDAVYRVVQHLSDLGWVDFDCGCSTICQVTQPRSET